MFCRFKRLINSSTNIRDFFNRLKTELKNIPRSIGLKPRINEVEKAVVAPDSFPQLFIHADKIQRFFASLELLSSLMKLSVLSKAARRQIFGLI